MWGGEGGKIFYMWYSPNQTPKAQGVLGGFGGKSLKSRHSEMLFPTFWVTIFLEHSGERCVTVANILTHAKLMGQGTWLLRIFGKVPRSSQHKREEGYSIFHSRASHWEFLLTFAVDFSEKIHKGFSLIFFGGQLLLTLRSFGGIFERNVLFT